MREVITIDFETKAIEDRPVYPPEPVGVAIKNASGSYYLSWGHPTGNNSTFEEAKAVLTAIWSADVDMLFHNAKFDLDVAETWFDLDMPPWDRVHDTMFLLYLHNPHARTVALKPSAELLLDWPPEEQDEVKEWVLANVKAATKKNAGAFICETPGELAGKYAIGDVDRTFGLFEYLMPYVVDNGMQGAYDRERQLMPILLESERHGILCDRVQLAKDLKKYEKVLIKITKAIHSLIGLPQEEQFYKSGGNMKLRIDSNAQLGDLLEEYFLADPSKWLLTKKGNRSVGKDSLEQAVSNKQLKHMLVYRGQLNNALQTFMRPWDGLTNGQDYDRLHTSWHQVRNPEGFGTRTGRVSSTRPNFANVPNEYEAPPKGFPTLPLMRSYLLPDEGHVWLKRDFSAQEIRILAHFEDGALQEAFVSNPELDPHQFAKELIMITTAIELDRSATKIIAFSICYGKGVKMLGVDLGVEYNMAFRLKDGYFTAFPGIEELSNEVKATGKDGAAVRTVGGRLMYSEPPVMGKRFDYKLLNHLIQGSASDLTKQSIIDYYDQGGVGHLLAQVYDEINLSVPVSYVRREDALLETAMAGINLCIDVPVTSDLYVGKKSWADADKHKNPDILEYPNAN